MLDDLLDEERDLGRGVLPLLGDLGRVHDVALGAAQRDGVARERNAGLGVAPDADDAAAHLDAAGLAHFGLFAHRHGAGHHAGFVRRQTHDVLVDALDLGGQLVVLGLLGGVERRAFGPALLHDGVHALFGDEALRTEGGDLFSDLHGNSFR